MDAGTFWRSAVVAVVSIVAGLLLVAALVTGGCTAEGADEETGDEPARLTLTVGQIEGADESALDGLDLESYAYTAWDKETGVCYLVVVRNGYVAVTPRLNADGSVVVVEEE